MIKVKDLQKESIKIECKNLREEFSQLTIEIKYQPTKEEDTEENVISAVVKFFRRNKRVAKL